MADRRELINNLRGAELPKSPWLDGSELPKNFPPVLVPVLIEESKEWLNGEQFNPRIHISQTDVGIRLRIWWRKDLVLFHEFDEPPVVPPFFLLDATADPELLRNVIDHTDTEEKRHVLTIRCSVKPEGVLHHENHRQAYGH